MEWLLIDDDLDDQEVFLMILEEINSNIKCATANNGVEALSILSDRTVIPDYIFIDVNMPKMNGIECLKGIKQIEHLRNSKIFMYSTTSELSVVEKSKELGAEDFIVKPSSPSSLKQILSGILNN
jgi:CheY-like chemotaxis protein